MILKSIFDFRRENSLLSAALCLALSFAPLALNSYAQDLCEGVTCDDADVCTSDSCENGECVFTPNTNPGCPGTCDPSGPPCDDGNSCTSDECVGGICQFPDVICPSSPCATGQCVSGSCGTVEVSCDDGDACTTDSCDPNVGCSNDPVNCDDNDANTADSCLPDGSCEHVCIGESCCNSSEDCNDGDECTIDSCESYSCTNTPLNCNDNNICTDDSCVAGACLNPPTTCNDNSACTDDSCGENGCEYIPNGTCMCISSDDCTAPDACSGAECGPDNNCAYPPIDCSGDPEDLCSVGSCDPEVGCVPVEKDCDDENGCTIDSCNSENGECQHDPDPACCDSDDDCDDGSDCTSDSCDTSTGQCSNEDNGSCCDSDECLCESLGEAQSSLSKGVVPFSLERVILDSAGPVGGKSAACFALPDVGNNRVCCLTALYQVACTDNCAGGVYCFPDASFSCAPQTACSTGCKAAGCDGSTNCN